MQKKARRREIDIDTRERMAVNMDLFIPKALYSDHHNSFDCGELGVGTVGARSADAKITATREISTTRGKIVFFISPSE